MAKPKVLSAKPGTQNNVPRRDNILTFTAPEGEPVKLLDFLFASMPDAKRTTVKDYLKYGQVMLCGQVSTRFDDEVRPADEVKVNTTRQFQVFSHPRMKLVYEDDDIIVVVKGYGLLSMGNDKVRQGTAYSILKEYIKTHDPRNKLFIVHRLDQHTSGLMVFAKSMEAKERLQHNWNNMVLRRQYVCVAEGRLDPAEGEVKSYLAENTQHIVYSTDDPRKGQLAYTRYRTLTSGNGYTLAEVELETGRKNQIRVHFKDLGHPIAGDRKYGAKTSPANRLCLHAMSLRFVHPVTRKLMDFTTPVPASFRKIVD